MSHTIEEMANNWWLEKTEFQKMAFKQKYGLRSKSIPNHIILEIYNAEHSKAHKPTEDKELFTPGEWKLNGVPNPTRPMGYNLYTKEGGPETIEHIAQISIGGLIDKERLKENALLIAASKDLYNALKKIHSECHKLLNRGTNEKLSAIDCLTIIGAIGETCESPLNKAIGK